MAGEPPVYLSDIHRNVLRFRNALDMFRIPGGEFYRADKGQDNGDDTCPMWHARHIEEGYFGNHHY